MTIDFFCPLCGNQIIKSNNYFWDNTFECVRGTQCHFFIGIDENQVSLRIDIGNWIRGKTVEDVLRRLKLNSFE